MIAGNSVLFDDGRYERVTTSGPIVNFCRVYKKNVFHHEPKGIDVIYAMCKSKNARGLGTVIVEDGTVFILEES
jgi:hypothetical protein